MNAKRAGSTTVSTPVVTEIVARPEPVVHDPFIDDLRASGASRPSR